MSTEASPHIVALRKQWKLNALAKRRIRISGGKTEIYAAPPPAQDLEAVLKAAVPADRANNLRIGDLVQGSGVFIGTWTPKDKDGKSLSRTFNVFAAPEDLPRTMRYVDTVKHVAALQNWHGYNGTNYANDKEIFAALQDGSYSGGWFIPPRELLSGAQAADCTRSAGAPVTQPDNIMDHRDKGALKGTFKTNPSSDHGTPLCYWSSTRNAAPALVGYIWSANITTGYEGNHYENGGAYLLSCRPVRLEPQ